MIKSKFICLMLLLTLSACGFKAVYGNHANSPLAQIYVNEIPTFEGQIVRNELQDMFAASGSEYILTVSLNTQRRNFGIQEDFRVSRYDIEMRANYILKSNSTGEVVFTNNAVVYSSFNRTESEFSTFIAEEDATKLAAEDLAFEIRSQIAAHFRN